MCSTTTRTPCSSPQRLVYSSSNHRSKAGTKWLNWAIRSVRSPPASPLAAPVALGLFDPGSQPAPAATATAAAAMDRKFRLVSGPPVTMPSRPSVHHNGLATTFLVQVLASCDVLIEAEEVLGVVTPLDLDQAVVVGPVGLADEAPVVGRHVVHVAAVGQVRPQLLEGLPRPGDVGLGVGGVGPLREQQQAVAGLAVGEGGGSRGDAGGLAVEVLEDDAGHVRGGLFEGVDEDLHGLVGQLGEE